jgi:uncharacterized protein YcgI (DUF1989 family)
VNKRDALNDTDIVEKQKNLHGTEASHLAYTPQRRGMSIAIETDEVAAANNDAVWAASQ